MQKKRLKAGIFSFTCCEGCQFTLLFLDDLMDILSKLDFQYFHLLKEKNRQTNFDIAFVEGAITSKREIKKLKVIRKKSKFLVAFGACACHGGIPAMRNFIESEELKKYVYSQGMLKDSIEASPIDKFVKVDYYMYGCPIIKEEFVDFINNFIEGKIIKQFEGPVCEECPRRGKNCLLLEKKECLGALTNGGCKAICPKDNMSCVMCRGPCKNANFAAEIALFKRMGLTERDIFFRLREFGDL